MAVTQGAIPRVTMRFNAGIPGKTGDTSPETLEARAFVAEKAVEVGETAQVVAEDKDVVAADKGIVAADKAVAEQAAIDAEAARIAAQQAVANPSIAYDTLAALNADLGHAASTVGQVLADGANNGMYVKSGASGSGSWVKKSTGTIPALAAAVEPSANEEIAHTFTDSLGFGDTYINRAGGIRSASGLLDVGHMRIADDYPGFAVTDEMGFCVFLDTEAQASVRPEPPPLEPEYAPLFGGLLCGAAGVETSIYMAGLIPERAYIDRVAMTLIGASGLTRTGQEQITIDPAKLGATATLVTRPASWDGGLRFNQPVSVKTAPVPAVSPTPVKILLIGDSIGNRQGGYLLQQYLTAWGYLQTFIGTMRGSASPTSAGDATGELGECREGWETGDYTNAITDRALPIAPGGEAAYLAMNKTAQRDYNPFIRAATGGDDPAIVRNGYVLDFGFYQSRFGLSSPDIVIYALGTNDVRDRDAAVIYETVRDNDRLILSRIRAAWPSCKIIRTLPGTVHIPTEVGHGYRFDAGRCTDLKAAMVPI